MPRPILLMVQSLGHGGCERDAAKLVTRLDRRQFDPRVGILRDGGYRTAEVQGAGVPIVQFPLTSFLNSSFVSAGILLRSYLQRENIELVHSFDVPTDVFSAPWARWAGTPKLITAQLSYRGLVSSWNRRFLRISDRLSDVVVVNSRAVGDSLVRDFKLPRDKVYLCYNGVNSQEFYPAEPRRPAYLQNASVVVGSVCVMRPEKRMDWVIEAFAKALPADPGAKLLLVGSGPEVPKLEALRDRLNLNNACFFEPGQADVAPWMRCMDVYINASVSESFPNALLEALACGCMAIGSRVGGIPELIADRDTGLLFDRDDINQLRDAIAWAISNSAERNTIRERGCATAHARFSMDNNVRRMEALYAGLLNGKGKPD